MESDEDVAVEEEKRKCPDCGKKFRRIRGLQLHSVSHKPPQFGCAKCARLFFRRHGLVKHLKFAHDWVDDGSVQSNCHCDVCGKPFLNRRLMDTHLKCHRLPTLNCHQCYRVFNCQSRLDYHLRVQHTTELIDPRGKLTAEQKVGKCEICENEFASSKGLTTHMRMQHKSFDIGCPKCPQKFLHHGHMANHMLKAHADWSDVKFLREIMSGVEGADVYRCAVCGKPFAKRSGLKAHLRCHHLPKFACPHCQLKFKHISSRRRHQHNLHGGETIPVEEEFVAVKVELIE